MESTLEAFLHLSHNISKTVLSSKGNISPTMEVTNENMPLSSLFPKCWRLRENRPRQPQMDILKADLVSLCHYSWRYNFGLKHDDICLFVCFFPKKKVMKNFSDFFFFFLEVSTKYVLRTSFLWHANVWLSFFPLKKSEESSVLSKPIIMAFGKMIGKR